LRHDLSDDEVHVYLSERVPDDPDVRAGYHALMSADERARYQRFALPRLQETHLLARALVRSTLSRYARAAPESWRFEVGVYGKPEVIGVPGLRFNLSHTDGLLACVVASGCDVGVDVEDAHRRSEFRRVARRFFAAAEVAALEPLPADAQREWFFDIWTLKEAYIKARGLGLPLPLKQFAFERSESAAIGVDFSADLGEARDDWQWALARPSPRHTLALALARGRAVDRRIRFFWSVPLVEVREAEVSVVAT